MRRVVDDFSGLCNCVRHRRFHHTGVFPIQTLIVVAIIVKSLRHSVYDISYFEAELIETMVKSTHTMLST